MKLNIKKPYASVKITAIHRQTGQRSKRKVRLLHEFQGKEYLTGSQSRPIPVHSIMVYDLITNA